MHQHKEVGGGIANERLYETWELKECNSCDRMVKETYRCEVVSAPAARKLEKEMAPSIIPLMGEDGDTQIE